MGLLKPTWGSIVVASIRQRLATPVVVDSKFLRELDTRIRALRPKMINHMASSEKIAPSKLAKLIERSSPPNDAIEAIIYKRALDYLEPQYKIEWKNDITLKVIGVEAAIEALDLEYIMPISLEVEMGIFRNNYINIVIDSDRIYPINLVAMGDIQDVRNIRESITNFINKHAPDYKFLHDSRMKSLFVALIAIFGLSGMFYNGTTFAFAETAMEKAILFSLNVVSVIFVISVINLYGKSFPSVVWKFGAGLKQEVFQKVFIGIALLLLSAIFIPLALK